MSYGKFVSLFLAFTPDGSRLVCANEGEPNSDYSINPEGSISVIDVKRHLRFGWQFRVREADFRKFDKESLVAAGVRIFGPGASAAQDLEPECCTISNEGRTAYVSLQENNAIAVVNLKSAKVRSIEALGRINHAVESAIDASDRDGLYEEIHAFGTRSFTIWKVGRKGDLTRVYDSGADFEKITASLFPADFNSNNDENGSFESRSDNKGPEPEGVAVGEVDGRMPAFVGLERIGGVMVYDISDPEAPGFVQYINPRDFTVPAEEAGDLGAEGIEFIPAANSPNGKPLLIVANEVSGNVSIYEIAH